MTTVSDGLFQYGGMPVTSGVPMFTGNAFFVNPLTGSDGNSGKSPDRPFASLYKAHAAATAGNHDQIFLIGSGSTTGTARLSLANAQLVDSSVSAGTLVWSKNSTHLIGIAAPGTANTRARIATPTGTYASSTFGSGNMVTVTASDCYFSNFSVAHSFTTGSTTDICWTDSGGRNSYNGVSFFGGQSTAAAAASGSMSLLVTGTTGENTFNNCIIGSDASTARTGSFAELNLTGDTPRNRFYRCVIQTQAGSTTAAFWVAIPNSGIDRYVLFDDCTFVNMRAGSGAPFSLMAVGFSLTPAPGGTVIMRSCITTGATKIDTNSVAVTNQAAGAAGGGLGVAIA